jgi:alcohol dehydrogenase
MGLVNSNTTPLLLKLVASGRLNVDAFATHQFNLHDMMDAYDTFSRAAETKALKVIINR